MKSKRSYNWPLDMGGGEIYLGDGVYADSRLLYGKAWLCRGPHYEDAVVHNKYKSCCHCGMTRKEAEAE